MYFSMLSLPDPRWVHGVPYVLKKGPESGVLFDKLRGGGFLVFLF